MKLTIAGTLSDSSIINGFLNDLLVFANSSESVFTLSLFMVVSIVDLLKSLLQERTSILY